MCMCVYCYWIDLECWSDSNWWARIGHWMGSSVPGLIVIGLHWLTKVLFYTWRCVRILAIRKHINNSINSKLVFKFRGKTITLTHTTNL